MNKIVKYLTMKLKIMIFKFKIRILIVKTKMSQIRLKTILIKKMKSQKLQGQRHCLQIKWEN